MPWFYYVGRFLVRITLLLLFNWQVRGRKNVPGQGPLLVVANHLHIADPPTIGVSLGRKTRFMAKKELFQPRFISYFISGFGAFPVRRGQLDRQAIRQAEQTLSQGLALIMFPESSRSKNAQLHPGYHGSALIALRTGVPVLPVAITGSEKVKGATWWLRRPRLTVNIGQPFQLPAIDGKITRKELEKMTDIIMGHIAELLPAEYRGSYAGKEN